jgi:putative cell wall-binding protein
VLGGTAAIPPSVDAELGGLGYHVVRLAGTNRMDTARLVAAEVSKRVQELGFPAPTKLMVTTAFNWPDAVTGGSFGALFGYPIVLTAGDQLSPEAQSALGALHPGEIDVLGGTAAVTDAVASAAGAAAGGATVRRLAGVDRDATAVADAQRVAEELHADFEIDPLRVVAINLRRSDGFTHALSASALVGAVPGVFLPIEGDDGTSIPLLASQYACELDPLYGIVAGGGDVVSDAVKQQLNGLLSRASGC